jgi:hypothetical protein
MKVIKLDTGIVICIDKKESIIFCYSIYDKSVTSKPLKNNRGIKKHSSYIPLIQPQINKWFQKHF